MRHLKWILLGTLLISIASCNGGRSKKREIGVGKRIVIGLYSPYGCYNQVFIGQYDVDTAIFGFRNSNSDTTIKTKKLFVLQDGDKNKLIALLNRINERTPVLTGRGHDLYRFTVTFDNKTAIDRDGQDTLLDSALAVLLPYAQIESNGECDYFNLYKIALDKASSDLRRRQ